MLDRSVPVKFFSLSQTTPCWLDQQIAGHGLTQLLQEAARSEDLQDQCAPRTCRRDGAVPGWPTAISIPSRIPQCEGACRP